jgi:hypothetical protein
MIWGFVFSYLEGRKTSEILGCGMCISFIVSSGLVKSCGQALLNRGVSQFWMPAAVGGIFYVPLVISVLFLESTPGPSEEDRESRTERVPMTGPDRLRFFKAFAPGLIAMTLFYTILHTYRDFRDNFAAELWTGWGYSDSPSVFAISELIVAIVTMVPVGCFMIIKSHRCTLISYHLLITCAMILTGVFTLMVNTGKVQGLPYMIMTGIGLYIGYVPFHSIIFDLIIATFKYKANCGFMMYVCDSVGYVCSIAVLFVKNFGTGNVSWTSFYYTFSYVVAIGGAFLILLSLIYWTKKSSSWISPVESTPDSEMEKCDDESIEQIEAEVPEL